MSLADFYQDFPVICDRLRYTKQCGRVAHAYLFVGDDADFLERFARAWIQVCACTDSRPDGSACGHCDACHRLTHQSYDALFEVRPQSKTRRILVDSIRELEHSLALTSSGRKLKVGLLVEADRMNEQGQNAFLKTLEEPAPGTMLILLATRPRQLLPTIRSRCQLISLRRNRRSYDALVETNLFPVLARLRVNAGASVALSVATELQTIMGSLRARAEEHVGEIDEQWQALAEEDRSLKKKLEAERVVRVESEYMRLRQDVMEAIQVWFQQQSLIAAGVPDDLLPHRELLVAASSPRQAPAELDPAAGEHAVSLVDDLLFDLAAHVNERLALEVFCLSVCERRS